MSCYIIIIISYPHREHRESMSTLQTTGKAPCVRCGKEKSAVRCEGCSQTFCYDHLADHRQELSHQLDEIETDRDSFRQILNLHITDQQKERLIRQIDHWKQESIQKIEKTAEECKQLVFQHITEQTAQVEIKLNKLTEDLRYIRRENDYNDADLMQLSARLKQLTKELNQSENIIIEQGSTTIVKGITVKVLSSSKLSFRSNNYLIFSEGTPSISLAASTLLAAPGKPSPRPTPIAFFSANQFDNVIIYFDQTYRHYLIHTCLPNLHFVHSDSYELLRIQQNQKSLQSEKSNDNNTAMIDSTTPFLARVIDKEYCQVKKPDNRFNVPFGTKFYRVRVEPWKPSISSSSN